MKNKDPMSKKTAKKLREINVSLSAAMRRYENAKQVLAAASAASNAEEAQAALSLLVATFSNPTFYPK